MNSCGILNMMQKGATLTLGRANSAHLDKYTAKEVKIEYEQAKKLPFFREVDCWGGNLDTGDRHYTYKNLI